MDGTYTEGTPTFTEGSSTIDGNVLSDGNAGNALSNAPSNANTASNTTRSSANNNNNNNNNNTRSNANNTRSRQNNRPGRNNTQRDLGADTGDIIIVPRSPSPEKPISALKKGSF